MSAPNAVQTTANGRASAPNVGPGIPFPNSGGQGRQKPNANGSPAGNRQGYAGMLSHIQSLEDIDLKELPRISTLSSEFDRVLGGGLVPARNSDRRPPRCRKSTLLLQTSCQLANSRKVLYITGEGVASAGGYAGITIRYSVFPAVLCFRKPMWRISSRWWNERSPKCSLLTVFKYCTPSFGVCAGSVSQVRDCAAQLTRLAKQRHIVVLLVGHVTKDGTLAGPKVLEHMIDCF